MVPLPFVSRLSAFSGPSRRNKKDTAAANTNHSTLRANVSSTPTIPPTTSQNSGRANPITTAAVAITEAVEPGPETPSVWLTDPTNARTIGKEIDIAVPTVSYAWPKPEAKTNTPLGSSNSTIGFKLVSRLKRRLQAKKLTQEKPSASSPLVTQSTTATIDANVQDDPPPPWTPPPNGLLSPDNAVAGAESNSDTIELRER